LGWGLRRLWLGWGSNKPEVVQAGWLLIKIIVEKSRKVQSRFFTFLGWFVLFFSAFLGRSGTTEQALNATASRETR